ncbi:hypothetical protein SKAU_G00391150 [Synaphobranchus kaupii]|uniref:Uncharacterized protein n=1 Tax=Synaphobranchus kaupii TaxID=118154 RepID=A0A9Q1IBL5_SYNKA|nr:hypothetical protein SKAU_G00391150 [Synaphobranchus kaupii]
MRTQTRKDVKQLKQVRDKMDFMLREEILEIERLQSLGAALTSQRETMQASLEIQRQEMDREVRALEMLREEKEEIEDLTNSLRKLIEVQREEYVAEKLTSREMWRKDLETLKMEEDELQASLKVERDKSERLKKKIKQEINRVREETEDEKENLRRAKETQMELLETERVIVETLERERNKKRAVVMRASAAVESERRSLQDDLVLWERERINLVNHRREERLRFEEEQLKMTNALERERHKNLAEREGLVEEKQTIIDNWQNEKAGLKEAIQRTREEFRTKREEVHREREKGLESNKLMLQKASEMAKEELEREKNHMRIAFQVKLEKMEAANTEQKKSMLEESMRLMEQFQKEMDCLHEQNKRNQAHRLKKRAAVEEDMERERLLFIEEHFRLEEQLKKMKWEKDNKRIAREEMMKMELKNSEMQDMTEQWAKLRLVKRKWWAIEKKVIQERKQELESQILASRKQWQVDRLNLEGEKKVAENQVKKGKIKLWFLSLIGCNK